jgi:hypothetical protein
VTLSVDVFVIGEDGRPTVLDVPKGHSDLAGFEKWRTKVWASPAVRALGARFFPRLDGDNLDVQPDEVPAFLSECALLRANLAEVAVRADVRPESIDFRLANIERAAHRAQEVGGGVVVW